MKHGVFTTEFVSEYGKSFRAWTQDMFGNLISIDLIVSEEQTESLRYPTETFADIAVDLSYAVITAAYKNGAGPS